MHLEHSCSIEENSAAGKEVIAAAGLYPDLFSSGLPGAQCILENKENNLKNSSLYPDLEALVKQNNLGKDQVKTDVNKLDSYPTKVENKLSKKIKLDLTDGETQPKTKVALKEKKCNKAAENDKKNKEKRKTKRKHKHLRRGYKVLAFTVGLPITLPYLMLRTTPNKEDDDIKSEFDQMASSTASLFKRKGKGKS